MRSRLGPGWMPSAVLPVRERCEQRDARGCPGGPWRGAGTHRQGRRQARQAGAGDDGQGDKTSKSGQGDTGISEDRHHDGACEAVGDPAVDEEIERRVVAGEKREEDVGIDNNGSEHGKRHELRETKRVYEDRGNQRMGKGVHQSLLPAKTQKVAHYGTAPWWGAKKAWLPAPLFVPGENGRIH